MHRTLNRPESSKASALKMMAIRLETRQIEGCRSEGETGAAAAALRRRSEAMPDNAHFSRFYWRIKIYPKLAKFLDNF